MSELETGPFRRISSTLRRRIHSEDRKLFTVGERGFAQRFTRYAVQLYKVAQTISYNFRRAHRQGETVPSFSKQRRLRYRCAKEKAERILEKVQG